jgi:hypothetical protein
MQISGSSVFAAPRSLLANAMSEQEELVWFFGSFTDLDPRAWRPMPTEIACEVERLFVYQKHQWSWYDNYLYDFCEMIQLNTNNGVRRPIRRVVKPFNPTARR